MQWGEILAARGLALRLYYYRSRAAVIPDAPDIAWLAEGIDEKKPHDHFTARVSAVDESG